MTSSPLRVGLCVARLEFGGTQRLVMELMRGLDRAEFDPVLIHFKDPNHYAEEIRAAGWRVVKVPMSRALRAREVRGLAAVLAGERIGLLHTHADFANFAGRAAGLLAGTPRLVAHYHGHYTHSLDARFRRLEAMLAPHTDRILTCSQSVADFVTGALEVGDTPVQRVLNGMDLGAFEQARAERAAWRERLGIGPRVFHIVHTGRLVEHKGADRLVRALCGAGERLGSWRATFVGGGDREDAIRELVAGCEARGELPAGAVVFTGWSNEVAGWLASADVSVMCSHHEGLGLSAVESLAAGTPVVASDIPGIREVVVDGDCGLLVDTADTEALLGALGRVRDDESLRSRLVTGGIARTALFSRARYLEEIGRVYCEVRESPRAKAPAPRGPWQRWRFLARLRNA